MIRRIITTALVLLMLSPLFLSLSYADNAEVLPKGVSRAALNNKIYFPIDERYDPDGNKEPVAINLNGVLDSSVFADLALVELGFGMPAGSANIGTTDISFEYDFYIVEFTYEYGITDKLSLGIKIPYIDVKNNVDANLITSNATVGKTAIGAGMGAPLAPLAGPFPDTQPLTSDDAQNLIGPGLDVNGDGTIDIAGYGYNRVEDWSKSGVSDIEIGGRYQYYRSENWRLAFTGGVRLPTGEVKDPDSLVDYGLGSGVWGLLFRFQNDYTGIKNLVLNATLGYDFLIPDKEVMRVPDDVNQPITANKEEVDRDVGDIFKIDTSATYQFLPAVSMFLQYIYEFKLKDRISGDMGFMYSSLEEETDYTKHEGTIGLSYSTIPLFREKKFPVPVVASVYYRDRFAGTNNVYDSQYIGIFLAVYF